MSIMKIIFKTIMSLGFITFSITEIYSQGGLWTWMKGDSASTTSGTYGTIGVPNINNTPPNKYQGAYCVDMNNMLWMYGGNGGSGMSDLWKYDHSNNMWTWMKGPQTQGQPPIYGIKGIASPSNLPHSTFVSGMMVCDSSNNLWHFGNFVNALWKYETSTNNWVWMHGDTVYNTPAVYGIKGVSSSNVVPGRVIESKSMWYCKSSHHIYVYDNKQCMWRYNINTNQWAWMKGDSTGIYYKYGTKGIEDSTIQPPPTLPNMSSENHVIWQDKNDMLYLFDQSKAIIWRYNPQTNNWMWLHGDTTASMLPILGQHCTRDLGLKPCGGNIESRGASAQFNGKDVFYLYSGLCWDNILWRFDLDSLEWIRVTGGGVPAHFGIQTTPDPMNHPPAADGHCLWSDNNNNVWLFSTYPFGPNFLWRFEPDPCCGISADTSGVNLNIPSNSTVCYGDTLKFPIDSNLNLIVTSTINNSHSFLNDTLMFHPTQTCVYTLIASVSNTCHNDTITCLVNIALKDTILHHILDTTICSNEISTLQIEDGYTINIFPNSYISINSDSTLIQFNPTVTTSYTLITTTNGLCPNTDTINFTINVNVKPNANFKVEPTIASISSPVFNYTNTSINALTYEWKYKGNVFSIDKNAQNTYVDTGLHCVTLIATNLNCSDSITHCNRIVEDRFFIPNAFSPNNDNLNDTFNPIFLVHIAPSNYVFRIFNRFGEKVFQSYDVKKGWNGIYKNKPCDGGVYYYYLTFNQGAKSVMYKGDVTLIR